jgi:hypothetical protein
MKQCPRCQAVVRDDTECPFCHERLTYEDPVMQDKPHTPWNRYSALYWLKAIWFPLLCSVICAVRLLTLPPTAPGFLEIGNTWPLLAIGGTLFFAFLSTLLANDPFCENDAFHEKWYQYRFSLGTYLLGSSAVVLSFLLFF